MTQVVAQERQDTTCADYDRWLFTAIESAGHENAVDPGLLFKASLAVLDARRLCDADPVAGLAAYKSIYID